MSEQNPHCCGDGGCVLAVPGIPRRMHTNGGCRCLSARMAPDERVRVRKGIRWLAERCSATLNLQPFRSIYTEPNTGDT